MEKIKRKIYADSEEKLVKNVIVCGDSDDGHLFYDCELQHKITKDDLLNLFTKGMIVCHNDEYYKPVYYKDYGGYSGVVVYNDTGKLTFHSEEKL